MAFRSDRPGIGPAVTAPFVRRVRTADIPLDDLLGERLCRRTCSGTGPFATDADAAAPKRRLFRLRVDQCPSTW